MGTAMAMPTRISPPRRPGILSPVVKKAKPRTKTGKAKGALRRPAPKPKKASPTAPRRNQDDFSLLVLREIGHEVGHRCSNPACQSPTSGPSKQKGGSNVGVGAHITAAALGGPRYDTKLTLQERRSPANAIWLCNSCGRLVDNDASTYTVGELAKWKVDAIDRAHKALASGGRSTAEGLFAAHIEIQRQALAQQREAQVVQMREQQLSKFGEMYGRFLSEAKACARATDEYWKWMHKTGHRADRVTREGMQKPVKEAREALERARQPILLSDADKFRGSLRWELLRGRGLEPVVDTIENQKAYGSVIHYHQLRLLDGINRLQDNVRETLGLPTRARTDDAKAFEDRMFTQAKAEANHHHQPRARRLHHDCEGRDRRHRERSSPLRAVDCDGRLHGPRRPPRLAHVRLCRARSRARGLRLDSHRRRLLHEHRDHG